MKSRYSYSRWFMPNKGPCKPWKSSDVEILFQVSSSALKDPTTAVAIFDVKLPWLQAPITQQSDLFVIKYINSLHGCKVVLHAIKLLRLLRFKNLLCFVFFIVLLVKSYPLLFVCVMCSCYWKSLDLVFTPLRRIPARFRKTLNTGLRNAEIENCWWFPPKRGRFIPSLRLHRDSPVVINTHPSTPKTLGGPS